MKSVCRGGGVAAANPSSVAHGHSDARPLGDALALAVAAGALLIARADGSGPDPEKAADELVARLGARGG